jgi:fatty acid desaturase
MKSKIKSRDPDIRGSLPALRRAARAARKLSRDTNTPFYVMKNGRIVDLNRSKNGKKHGRGARATG